MHDDRSRHPIADGVCRGAKHFAVAPGEQCLEHAEVEARVAQPAYASEGRADVVAWRVGDGGKDGRALGLLSEVAHLG